MPSIAHDYTNINYVNTIRELHLNYPRIIVERKVALDQKDPKGGYPYIAEKDGSPYIYFPDTDLGAVNIRIIAEFNEHLLLKTQKKEITDFKKRMWKRVFNFCEEDDELPDEKIKEAIRYLATVGKNSDEDRVRHDYMYLTDPDREINDVDFKNVSQERVYMYIKKRKSLRDEENTSHDVKLFAKRRALKKITGHVMRFVRRRRMLAQNKKPYIYYPGGRYEERRASERALMNQVDNDADQKVLASLTEKDIKMIAEDNIILAALNKKHAAEQAALKALELKNKLNVPAAVLAVALKNKKQTDVIFNALLEGKAPPVIAAPVIVPSQSFSDSDVILIEQPSIDPIVSSFKGEKYWNKLKLDPEEEDMRFSQLPIDKQNALAFERAKQLYNTKKDYETYARKKIRNQKKAGKKTKDDAAVIAKRMFDLYEKEKPALPPYAMLSAMKQIDPRTSLVTTIPKARTKKKPTEKKKAAEKKVPVEKKKPGKPKKKVMTVEESKEEKKVVEKKKPGRPKKKPEEKKGPRIGAPSEFLAGLAAIGKKPKPNAAVENDRMRAEAIHKRTIQREKHRKKKEDAQKEDEKLEKHQQAREETLMRLQRLKKSSKARKKLEKALAEKKKKMLFKKGLRVVDPRKKNLRRKAGEPLASENRKRKRISIEPDEVALALEEAALALTEPDDDDTAEALTLVENDIEKVVQLVAAASPLLEPTSPHFLPTGPLLEPTSPYILPTGGAPGPDFKHLPPRPMSPLVLSQPPVIIQPPTAIAQPPVNFLQPPALHPQDPVALLNQVKDLICNDDPRIVAARIALGCPPPAN